MGAIIRMDSEKFFKKFLEDVKDTSQYQFILISSDIKIKDKSKYSNVMAFPNLIPVPAVVSLFVNGEMANYKQAFLNQLQHIENDSFVSILVKAAVVNDMKVVLLCSKSESDKKYLEMICDYIEAAYNLPSYTWKKYKENPEKANKIKNVDEIKQILVKKKEKMEKHGVSLEPKVTREELTKVLKETDKKALKKLAKKHEIKLKKDMGKKDIIKKLVSKLVPEQ